ncbi:hypothetical protein [Sphingobium cloacae]|nr:hypothetical protein [Sphingobium cloacae]
MQDTPIADPDKFSLDEGTGDPQADADRLLDEARTCWLGTQRVGRWGV